MESDIIVYITLPVLGFLSVKILQIEHRISKIEGYLLAMNKNINGNGNGGERKK